MKTVKLFTSTFFKLNLQHEPLEVLIRFILMVVAGCLRLYISAKPADDLKENVSIYRNSQKIAPNLSAKMTKKKVKAHL